MPEKPCPHCDCCDHIAIDQIDYFTPDAHLSVRLCQQCGYVWNQQLIVTEEREREKA